MRSRTSAGRAFVVASALLCASGQLAACSSVTSQLGSHASPCFRVLPAARLAVGGAASFSGVSYLPAGQLIDNVRHAHRRRVKVPDALADAFRLPTCLVSYKGRFSVARVVRGWAPLPGPWFYAIVVIKQQDDAVIGTVLFHKVPLRFAHFFTFGR